MKKWIISNTGLKIIALILAIFAWFYITIELKKGSVEEQSAILRFLPYKVVAKQVPVSPKITGTAPAGYSVDTANIKVEPNLCVIMGPREIIESIKEVNTTPINISEYTKNITRYVAISPLAGGLLIEEVPTIKVEIPIQKIPEPTTAEGAAKEQKIK